MWERSQLYISFANVTNAGEGEISKNTSNTAGLLFGHAVLL